MHRRVHVRTAVRPQRVRREREGIAFAHVLEKGEGHRRIPFVYGGRGRIQRGRDIDPASLPECGRTRGGRSAGDDRSSAEKTQYSHVASDQSARLSSRVKPRPATPMIVSATVHVSSVWGTLMSKNSFTSQKPASLTCDSTSDPAPVASTSSSAGVPNDAANGATMPDAVVIATVAEPVATRINAATTHASTIGEA